MSYIIKDAITNCFFASRIWFTFYGLNAKLLNEVDTHGDERPIHPASQGKANDTSRVGRSVERITPGRFPLGNRGIT